jgi:5-methyltetrahydrofolate--homocysteine methyltransferase
LRLKDEELRKKHLERRKGKDYINYVDAKANGARIDWKGYKIPVPSFLGNKVINDYPIDKIRKYIDWTPFFSTWMLKGKYPAILEDEKAGTEARKLLEDANRLLDRIVEGNLLNAKVVLGFYPVNRIGDDIVVFSSNAEERDHILSEFHFLRQQGKKAEGIPDLSLSDFVAPEEYGHDYMGFFAVTTGHGVEGLIEEYESQNDDYGVILVKAVADRLAEGLAEAVHEEVRKNLWGYDSNEDLTNEELIKEKYLGIRPAPGYPACPDHTEKSKIWKLLDAEKNTGISLTESFAMAPASSVSGYYFSHPESKYFPVGQIGKDQVEDYARRKGMSVGEVEKWLAPNLNYDK